MGIPATCCPIDSSQAAFFVKAAGQAEEHDFAEDTIERYVFDQWGLRAATELDIIPGNFGNRQRAETQGVEGLTNVSGTIRLRPSRHDLDFWLPRILGAAEDDNNFYVATTLPEWHALVDKSVRTEEFQFCKVARAVFSGTSGESLTLTMDAIGLTAPEFQVPPDTSDANPGTALEAAADNTLPMAFHRAELDIGGTSKVLCFANFELTIDHQAQALFYNSRTPKCVLERQRLVRLRLRTPFNSTSVGSGEGDADLLSDDVAFGKSGSTEARITFLGTDGTTAKTSFVLPSIKYSPESPEVGDNPLELEINAECFAQGDGVDENAEIWCFNDNTAEVGPPPP